MPYVLKANQHAVAPRLQALARYLALPDDSPGAVLDWVLALRETVGTVSYTHLVEPQNTAARALYGRYGFKDCYAYWYRLPAEQAAA